MDLDSVAAASPQWLLEAPQLIYNEKQRDLSTPR
jgi:hypothetical protein